jgi:hypothetical protein
MVCTAFTVTVPADRIDELRQLLAELNKDVSGLAERARAVGYHRERMWLQYNADGDGQLIVYLEFDDHQREQDVQDVLARIATYENEFTRWWNPRYNSFLSDTPTETETLFAWDDEQSNSGRKPKDGKQNRRD